MKKTLKIFVLAVCAVSLLHLVVFTNLNIRPKYDSVNCSRTLKSRLEPTVLVQKHILQNDQRFLAVLATTWLPEKEKEVVHKNVARIWGWWPGILQPVVYVNLSQKYTTFWQCVRSGWRILPIQETKCEGIPVLKSMFIEMQKKYRNRDYYGFANSDIVFDPGLMETFNFVKKRTSIRPLLLVGLRTNVNFSKPHEIFTPKEVNGLAKNGKLMKRWAIDYFITDSSFPWEEFPELVVGRYYYDNYIIYFARKIKAQIIDVTRTVVAVHQTTQDGNDAGHHRHHRNCNKDIIKTLPGNFSTLWGYITCVKTFTQKDKSGNIILSTRKLAPHCEEI